MRRTWQLSVVGSAWAWYSGKHTVRDTNSKHWFATCRKPCLKLIALLLFLMFFFSTVTLQLKLMSSLLFLSKYSCSLNRCVYTLHARAHTHTHRPTHPNTHARTQARTAHKHARTHARTHIHTHAHTQARTYPPSHTHTHTHTPHTHTHTHTNRPMHVIIMTIVKSTHSYASRYKSRVYNSRDYDTHNAAVHFGQIRGYSVT